MSQACKVFFDIVIPSTVSTAFRKHIKQQAKTELRNATTKVNRFRFDNLWGLNDANALEERVLPSDIKTFIANEVVPNVHPTAGPIADLTAVPDDTYCFNGEDRICYHGFRVTLDDGSTSGITWTVSDPGGATYPILVTLKYGTQVFPDSEP